MHGKRVSIEEFKEKLRIVHGDVLSVEENSFVNMTTKAIFIDKEFGIWLTLPCSVVDQKSNHPQRAKQNRQQTNIEKNGSVAPSRKKKPF